MKFLVSYSITLKGEAQVEANTPVEAAENFGLIDDISLTAYAEKVGETNIIEIKESPSAEEKE